ncbi:glutathione S-transferase N-terminal domain-containing protein [Tychonema sp. BBK16]|uniref:glutathione S-transferase N-terminal domain-containing protein n=1 Tax=Tychonema sp. BBK16 TaxID=2699888 RepID=UPI001F39B8C6|nr:glutathione S-transferase N-terminal domain-containing protein [Tychonema sp. BBK16]MCF6374506.1 hypothetical protein [Tychonema sp. BBK16]
MIFRIRNNVKIPETPTFTELNHIMNHSTIANTEIVRLITIPISHYCEKVRWALDLLKIPYIEERKELQSTAAGVYALRLYREQRQVQ